MHADGQHSGRQHAEDDPHRRDGNGRRYARWPYRTAMMRLPGGQQRALHVIEQALVAEDPVLGLRFAFFARLTRHEAMPGTEQVPGRRFLRRAVVLPLLAVSLLALLAASLLVPGSGQACPAGPNAAAHDFSSLSRSARCQPGPAIKADTMPVH
jgi:hypothetical protein